MGQRTVEIDIKANTPQAEAGFDRVASKAKGLKNAFDDLNSHVERDSAKSSKTFSSNFHNAFDQLDKESKQATGRLRDEMGRFVKTGGDAFHQLDQEAARAAKNSHDSFSDALSAGFFANLASQAGTAFLNGVRTFVTESIQSSSELQQSVANSLSIKPELDTSQVRRELSDMQVRVPQNSKQLADSLYDVFSSINVTQTEGLKLVEKFGRGATAAVTDAKTFGTAVIGEMNAYKLSLQDVDHIQDVFFNTVAGGVVSGQELASNLGVVTQAGKNAGVSLDELGGLIAGVTKEGGSAALNINNLANTLMKLPTKEVQKGLADIGVATKNAKGEFLPILDVLGKLKDKLDKMPPAIRAARLQDIFPDTQARTGVQTLLSQLSFVREQIDLNTNSEGSAARAYAVMADTYATASIEQENAVNSLKEAVGDLVTQNPGWMESTKIVTTQIQDQTEAIRDEHSATNEFATGVINNANKIKVNILPFMAFMAYSGKAILQTLLVVVTAVVGAIAWTIEHAVNLVRDNITDLLNLFVSGINKIGDLLKKLPTSILPPELAALQSVGTIEPFKPGGAFLGSDTLFANLGKTVNELKDSLHKMGQASDEGLKADKDLTEAIEYRKRVELGRAEAREMKKQRLDAQYEKDHSRLVGLSNQLGGGNQTDSSQAAAAGGAAKKAIKDKISKDYIEIADFARTLGFTVTSTTGGKHNVGSKHALGEAVDIRTSDKTPAEIAAFMDVARKRYKVVDERVRPDGQKVWDGAHLHLEKLSTGERAGDTAAKEYKDLFPNINKWQALYVKRLLNQRRAELPILTDDKPDLGQLSPELQRQADLYDQLKQKEDDLAERRKFSGDEYLRSVREQKIQIGTLDADLSLQRRQNADKQLVEQRRLLSAKQEQYDLEQRISRTEDDIATGPYNESLRVQAALLENIASIRRRDEEALISQNRSQLELADKQVYHAAQANAKVLDFLAQQKSVTDIVADGKIGLLQKTFDGIDSALDRAIPKLHGFGDIFKQIIADLLKLEASKFLMKVLGFDGATSTGNSQSQSQASGGFSFSNIASGVKKLFSGGANSPVTTGGFSGGNPAAEILSGNRQTGLVSSFRSNGLVGGLKNLLGFGGGAASSVPSLAAAAPGITSAGVTLPGALSAAQISAVGGGTGAAGSSSLLGGLSLAKLGAFATNPITLAVAGAAVGAFLLWKHFSHGTEKKLREAIKGQYGVSVKDMKTLSEIKQIGEGVFGKGQVGKHLQETINLDPVKESIRAYAESTRQQARGLTTNAQYADPNFKDNQFIRRLSGGIVPFAQRGYDHVRALLDGGEYVNQSSTVAREGQDAFDALNAGHATIVPTPASTPPATSRASSSSQSGNGNQRGSTPASMTAALVGTLDRIHQVLGQFEAEDENVLFKRMAKKNPRAVADAMDTSLGQGYRKPQIQQKLNL